MQPTSPAPHGDNRGLPPVEPPSAGHIIKLFVVPLVIVGCLVGLLWAFQAWRGGGVFRPPQDFLKDLKSDNWNVRWRAAQELAQVLLRDDRLASDPALGLGLTGELRDAWQKNQQLAQDSAGVTPKELAENHNYMLYLTSMVGNLKTPVGVGVLEEMAREGGAGSAADVATRRWRALWSLANLGENLRKFEALPADRKEAVLAELTARADAGGPEAADAARARDWVRARQEGRPDDLGVGAVLVRGMGDKNPFLREVAVFASNFWTGDPATEAQVEEALRERLDDKGGGEELLAPFYPDGTAKPPAAGSPGQRVRYNAAVALARRGSAHAPVDMLAEMLDEGAQRQQSRKLDPAGKAVADEATAQETVLTALRAVAELHRKNPKMSLAALDGPLGKLKTSASPALRQQAERTWAELHPAG